MDEKEGKLVLFEGKRIRRIWYEDDWYFSVVDVVEVLTESPSPKKYWYQIKEREFKHLELSPIWRQLKLPAEDGKMREADCANTKNMLRIIQSIPSKRAEPFKQWLAKVGYERIQEIENPELAQERMKLLYEQKGYPKEWIEKRLRGIAIRQELTDEWKTRGVQEQKDFAILTNEITKATFDKTVEDYKRFKGLERKNQNLRDHMTDWELILTMVGEKATTDITISKESKGFDKCKDAATEGGKIAKNTRKEIEAKTGKSLVSEENYLHLTETKKKHIEQQETP